MTPAALVILSMMVCDAAGAHAGDDCDTIEVRARSCEEAAAWARGWIPPGRVVAWVDCRDERIAAR